MRINLDWLREFVPFTADPKTLAHDLTMAGLEVEGIEEVHGDAVFEIGVTPNRMDCLSHLGVARDVAALYRLPLTLPPTAPPEGKGAVEAVASIEVEDPEGCPRYTARVVHGAAVKPSPEKAARRLESVGVRSINSVVDATNYVMMELGQPLHAFDLSLLAQGRIVVRRAGDGDRFTTLDGQERSLLASDLLICDGAGPVALAGVMGGANSEVRPGTTTLLLESACFDPMTIRRTAKRLSLPTEASYRFERGTDPEGTVRAVDRLALLVTQWSGGSCARGALDAYPRPFPSRRVTLSLARLSALLGIEVPEAEVVGILTRLGFTLSARKGEVTAGVPSWRRDVGREEDLVEEVARIHGFDKIPATLPVGRAVPVKTTHGERVERAARLALEAAGFTEAITYSFIGRADLARMKAPAGGEEGQGDQPSLLGVRNPLSEETEVMRPSLLPGLLLAAARNQSRRIRRCRLYEVGNAFAAGKEGGRAVPVERKRIAGVLYGERIGKPWYRKGEESTFFDAKGAVESVLAALGVDDPLFRREDLFPEYAPGQSGEALQRPAGDEEPLRYARLGTLHPEVAAAYGLSGWVGCFEMDLSAMESSAGFTPRFRPLPRTPEVLRDLSLLVPRRHDWEQVQTAVRGAAAHLASLSLFDLYEGKGVPEGHRSLAFSLVFQDPERTLTDEEVDAEVARILEVLQKEFEARLR